MKNLEKYLMLLLALVALGCKEKPLGEDEELGTERYKSLVFTQSTVEQNVVYGNAVSQSGASTDLKFDLYQPVGDDQTQRPLVILAHGGGFTGGDKEEFEPLSDYLARSGYVVASITYRLIDVEPNPEIMKKGVIDAVQDMKACVRYFRNDAAQANSFGIDPDKIFVGGYSAGAVTSLHLAYLSDLDEVQNYLGSTTLDYVQQTGGLEGNSGTPGVASDILGVINLAGALISTEVIDAGEPPLYSAHGTEDAVVPFLEGEADNSGISTQGPGLIHPELDAQGIFNLLRQLDGEGHDAFFECQDCNQELRSFLAGLI